MLLVWEAGLSDATNLQQPRIPAKPQGRSVPLMAPTTLITRAMLAKPGFLDKLQGILTG